MPAVPRAFPLILSVHPVAWYTQLKKGCHRGERGRVRPVVTHPTVISVVRCVEAVERGAPRGAEANCTAAAIVMVKISSQRTPLIKTVFVGDLALPGRYPGRFLSFSRCAPCGLVVVHPGHIESLHIITVPCLILQRAGFNIRGQAFHTDRRASASCRASSSPRSWTLRASRSQWLTVTSG